MSEEKNEGRFHGDPARLRSSERLALMEVERVVALSIEGLASGRVLDIGTGTGLFAEGFLASGFEVAGVDQNDAMLQEARRLVPGAEFKQGNAEAIPYGDKEFDLSFLGVLLHEVDDPVQTLREARRLTRSRVVVLEWPYVDDGHRPPLKARLSVGRVTEIAKQAGLGKVEHVRLAHTDLYRIEV